MSEHILTINVSVKDWTLIWSTIMGVLKILGVLNIETWKVFAPVLVYAALLILGGLLSLIVNTNGNSQQ